MGDRVGVGGVLEDVKLGNNGLADGAGNQDNRHATVEDVENSDDVLVNPTNGVLADILAHPFGPLSPQSNSPPGINTTCSGRSHGNKFKFLFISLLTLLLGLTEFLMSEVVVQLTLLVSSPHYFGAKRVVAATIRAFSIGSIFLFASNIYV